MKRFTFLFLLFMSVIGIYSFPVDTVRINRAFALMVESKYTAESQKEFFDAFPITWHEYWLTYGNIPSFNNMKRSFKQHMFEGLYKLDQIPDSLFYDRLITLGIAGMVKTDDVGGALQDLIRKKLRENPKLMMSRLSKKWYTSYFPFWYFVFNGLSYQFDNLELYSRLNNFEIGYDRKYPEIMLYMEQAFILSNGKERFENNLFSSYDDSHREYFQYQRMQVRRSDGVYLVVEHLPEYPGGMTALKKFIKSNFKLPDSYTGKDVFVVLKAVINEDGKIISSVVDKSYDEVVDCEAIRVVSMMPRWIPAMNIGKNVPFLYTIPFSLSY